jgi:hypothetical protein
MASPLEKSLRAALANPEPALAYLGELGFRRLLEAFKEMSSEEVWFCHEFVVSGRKKMTDDERATLADLAERRKRGELLTTEQQQERRRIEGWWYFENSLRLFAGQNGLPLPDYCHGLNAYREHVARELLARYGWSSSSAGEPLEAWEDADRNAMMEVFALVKVEAAGSSAARSGGRHDGA